MSDTLILNANYQPLSWLPLSIIPWQQAVKLLFLDKIKIMETYADWEIHSPSTTMQVPALAITRDYHNFQKGVRFSRQNLYLRDLFQCQYCGDTFESADLTIDHVHPLSKGGKTNWENCVAACYDCNTHKSNKYQRPLREPFKPDYWTLINRRKRMAHFIRHPSWKLYLE
jgi:5-methylcytosine-specific restriction endonuclease McrA